MESGTSPNINNNHSHNINLYHSSSSAWASPSHVASILILNTVLILFYSTNISGSYILFLIHRLFKVVITVLFRNLSGLSYSTFIMLRISFQNLQTIESIFLQYPGSTVGNNQYISGEKHVFYLSLLFLLSYMNKQQHCLFRFQKFHTMAPSCILIQHLVSLRSYKMVSPLSFHHLFSFGNLSPSTTFSCSFHF